MTYQTAHKPYTPHAQLQKSIFTLKSGSVDADTNIHKRSFTSAGDTSCFTVTLLAAPELDTAPVAHTLLWAALLLFCFFHGLLILSAKLTSLVEQLHLNKAAKSAWLSVL